MTLSSRGIEEISGKPAYKTESIGNGQRLKVLLTAEDFSLPIGIN